MSMTSASDAGTGARGAAGTGGSGGNRGSGGRCRRRAGPRRRRGSQFAPFGVGLGGVPEQGHVAQQHDRRRHDHPPGRQLGDSEGARSDDQHQEHAEQPPPCGQYLLVLLVTGGAAGFPSRGLAASLRNLGSALSALLRPGFSARLGPDPSAAFRAGCRMGHRSRVLPPRPGRGLLARRRRVRFRRGEVVAGRLARGRISPEPPGNEHASPDRDDGDVQYRAAQCSSPRGPPLGAVSAGRPGGGFHGPRV